MKRNKKSKIVTWKTVLLVVILTIVCVGGMELLVCRIVDPPRFRRWVAPVVELTQQISEEIDNLLAQFEAPEEPSEDEAEFREEDYQVVSEPSILYAVNLDPTITELVERDEREMLIGGNYEIVYYNQADEAWADLPYGSDKIRGYGCGPVAMAMAISSMTQYDITPGEMAVWAREQGHWARRSGSYLTIVSAAAEAYGLHCEPMSELSANQLVQALSGGQVAVALMGPGHFTSRGHFILLRGVTLSGDILVADPNSRERSLSLWDAQLLIDELSASRHSGAPLWLLSPEAS